MFEGFVPLKSGKPYSIGSVNLARICFLQETYSTRDVENIWRKQWRGDLFFSHGTCQSKGVLVLVKNNFDFNLQTIKTDPEGRFIMLDAIIQDSRYCLLNIYAPNKCSEQIQYFQNISEEIKSLTAECDSSLIVGGDFNVILDEVLDGRGGNKKRKESAKFVEEMCVEHDLDIWRIRNPTDTRFTWRQKTPIIQRRLDYWLVSDCLQVDIDTVDIITAIKSDHSATTLRMNSLDESLRGPSFWKFNSNLVNDSDYCQLISANYNVWLEEFKEVLDKGVLWDLVKYRIRQCTIEYRKSKARERKAKLQEVEECIKECSHKCDKDPSSQNLEELESLEAEYENLYDFITQGAIIRSRATWYEMGERNNKYFLNLENSNKKKTSVRKVFTSEGSLTHDPQKIMNELESYYSGVFMMEIVVQTRIPYLHLLANQIKFQNYLKI